MCFQGDTVNGRSKTVLKFWMEKHKQNKNIKQKSFPQQSPLASSILTSLLFCHSCYLDKLWSLSQYLPLLLLLLQGLCKDSVPLWTWGSLEQITASVTNTSDCSGWLYFIVLVKNVSRVFVKGKDSSLSNSTWHCCYWQRNVSKMLIFSLNL